MIHLVKFNESKSERIPQSIIDVVKMFSEYNSDFDILPLEVFSKLNQMSDEDLKETYLHLSTNYDNSDEDKFMLDLMKYFNLVK
jgi:hypothetical protein